MKAAEIDCQDIEERLGHLQSSWDTLREAAAGRLQRLRDAHEAQQYYLDAGEAEAWISEQELYVFSDEPPKVHGRGGRVRQPAEQIGRAVVGKLLESLEIQVCEKVRAKYGCVGNPQSPALLWYPLGHSTSLRTSLQFSDSPQGGVPPKALHSLLWLCCVDIRGSLGTAVTLFFPWKSHCLF